VTVSLRDPGRTHAVNVEGTRAVARIARDRGARLVSASSAAVYGEPAELPLRETAPKAPTNAYGDSKLAAELVLIEELAGADTDFASVRFSNVYGPRQDALGEGGVVAIFAGSMTGGDGPVIDGDGRQTRDFVYVGDVVKALMDTLTTRERLAVEGLDGPAYNISTGEEVSVVDLAGRLASLARFPGGLQHGPSRPGDVARSALDPEKAHRVFGWRSGVPLDTGLELTLAWFAERR
jgi:UDP-glucose 4-epimerase